MADVLTMTEQSLEFQLQRSSAGGRHDALRQVVGFLLLRSGEAYSRGSDVEAKIVRDLAHEVKVWQDKAASELDKLNAERVS